MGWFKEGIQGLAELHGDDSQELTLAMKPYIDSGQYSEQQLAEIKKNISNRLKN